jgi:lysophospholipase L1-like esterase
MKKVICIGDSITYGRVGASYYRMLKAEFPKTAEFINKGINGNLTYDVLKRLDEVAKLQPDILTLLIGTNDVWATHSESVSRAYIKRNKLPETPTKQSFERNLVKILQKLKTETNAVIAVMSLPLITEDPQHILFKRTIEYSEVIKDIAAKLSVFYIPVSEAQKEYLKQTATKPKLPQEISWGLTMKAIFKRKLFRKSYDKISEKNGFLLTIDGVHPNSTGAKIIKDCVTKFLKEHLS